MAKVTKKQSPIPSGKVRIELHLTEKTARIFQALADADKRSRKSFMEIHMEKFAQDNDSQQ